MVTLGVAKSLPCPTRVVRLSQGYRAKEGGLATHKVVGGILQVGCGLASNHFFVQKVFFFFLI
jgi:hypothetical protein